MTWSDSGWVELACNFVCNFRVESDFFEFRVKYFVPYPTRYLVGSGRVFFGGLGRIYRIGWSVIVMGPNLNQVVRT